MSIFDVQQSDAAAAVAVQHGKVTAYHELVERYYAPLVRYAWRFLGNQEDAEDIVQNVFLKAYANIRQYDPHRAFSTWIYRITHNECVNLLKRRHREPISFFDPDTIFPHPIAAETPADQVERNEMLDLIERYLAALDPKYREPVILHYIAERSYEEISDIMHIPISTVGIRLKRARDRLRLIRAQQ
ncbi:MAG: RNA polymerase sigma factor [Candidatus Uhrbacteria bacterium]